MPFQPHLAHMTRNMSRTVFFDYERREPRDDFRPHSSRFINLQNSSPPQSSSSQNSDNSFVPKGKKRNIRRRRNVNNEIPRLKAPRILNQTSDIYYIVEKINGKRFNESRNEFEYLVKWLHYTDEFNSWEPQSELEQTCKTLLDNFEGNTIQESTELHCICKQPYKFDDGAMIQCLHCMTWYHFKCIGLHLGVANRLSRWYCEPCRTLDSTKTIQFKD